MRKYITLLVWCGLLSGSLGAQNNIAFKSRLSYSQELNDIWGYTDEDGREYGLVGAQHGVSIVDVTDNKSPKQLFFVPGPKSVWRDLKTHGKRAYVTHDSSPEESVGLLIINLEHLPDSISYHHWTGGDSINLRTSHNLYIDNGYAYLFGSNLANGGALILDLADPDNPTIAGKYIQAYLHDGYVRNNLLYGAEMGEGGFSIVDVSDKANPVVLAKQQTPHLFCHNVWPSDDGTVLFTTDEKRGAFVTAYDISDLSDIEELDRYQTNRGEQIIPHNVHVLNDFLITSYYTDGVTIVDASEPGKLVETGHFDASPLSGTGFAGAWGVYPFFPSGTMLVTEIEGGLWVLQPDLTRGAFVRGRITDSLSGNPLRNVQVALIDGDSVTAKFSTSAGDYTNGSNTPGTFDLEFSANHCEPKRFSNVQLVSGDPVDLDVILDCDLFIKDYKLLPLLSENGAGTEIYYESPNTQDTWIRVYNMQGRLVQLQQVTNRRGYLAWDGRLANGLYVVELSNPGFRATVKAVKMGD